MSTWRCPVCDDLVPVTTQRRRWRRWRRWTKRRRLVFTPSSWADLHAHLWSHQ